MAPFRSQLLDTEEAVGLLIAIFDRKCSTYAAKGRKLAILARKNNNLATDGRQFAILRIANSITSRQSRPTSRLLGDKIEN